MYSSATIHERYEAFDQAFHEVPHTICYSVKANSNLSILRMLAQKGCGFDVVSGGELSRVVKADRKAVKRVVFSGVGKTREELTAAIKAGILLFNVESESELAAVDGEVVRTAVDKRDRMSRVVNRRRSHRNASVYFNRRAAQTQIWSADRQWATLYAKAARDKYLAVRGVSVHIGSQITDPAPFAEAMARVADLVRELRSDGHAIEFVDAGGGLGISYDKPNAVDFDAYVKTYARELASPLKHLGLHLLLEPGRSIIAPAGILLTRVVYKKANEGKRFDWIMRPLSVWQTGAAGRAVSCSNPEWRREFETLLPDLTEDDICGSGFAITAYSASEALGGEAALAELSRTIGQPQHQADAGLCTEPYRAGSSLGQNPSRFLRPGQ